MNKEMLKANIQATVLNENGEPALSSAALDVYLEQARQEYGKYRPSPRVLAGSVSRMGGALVTSAEEEIVAVSGVYGQPNTYDPYYGNTVFYGFDTLPPYPLADLSYDVAMNYINAFYREKASMEIDFYTVGNRIIPTLPAFPARIVAVYGVVPTWEEIPESQMGLLTTFILGTAISSNSFANLGVMSIPTPVGAFEFDAGKNSQIASRELLNRFYSELGSSASYVTSG